MRIFSLAIISITVIFIFVVNFPPSIFIYNKNHKNYYEYSNKIMKLNSSSVLNFEKINDGHWKVLCLFGGYTNPSKYMSKYSNIPFPINFVQNFKSYSVFRFSEVEEFESLISYIDSENYVHFMHMDATPEMNANFSLEHRVICVTRENPIAKIGNK